MVDKCTQNISGMPNVAIWLFTLFVFVRVYQLLLDFPRLKQMKEFYEHLLGVPDTDMQTISWQEIIARLMALRDENPATAERISSRNRKFIDTQSKQRLDAHDIANRLMRKDNYLIALFNKEILNLDINLPFLRGRQISADWFFVTLDWCIMDLVFNEQGQVRQLVLKDTRRKELSKALRNRFLFAGYMHLIASPLLLLYLVIIYFLKYFNVCAEICDRRS
jgi:autophagy-related protein 9